MNGEIGLASRLTIAAKNAVKGGPREFARLPYENSITFIMEDGTELPSADEWLNWLVEDGNPTIFMFMPHEVKDRRVLGFPNTSNCIIYVRRTHKQVSSFTPHWDFDKENKVWNITITQRIMNQAPKNLPTFADNSEALAKALDGMEKFAEELGFPAFRDCFAASLALLEGSYFPTELVGQMQLPEMDEDKQKIYLACVMSDVFGGTGSWNDSPEIAANEKGLLEKYNTMSGVFLSINRLNLMYAVNN